MEKESCRHFARLSSGEQTSTYMLLASLSDNAHVWLFAANRALSDDEQTAALAQTRSFLDGWTSHGRPVPGEAELLHQRVLVVGGHLSEDELNAGVSGCGIDSLTRAVEGAAAKLGFDWAGVLDVLYYDVHGTLRIVSRSEFRRLAGAGAVTSESLVLDLTTTSAGELRTNGAKRRAADTWHAGLIRLAQPA